MLRRLGTAVAFVVVVAAFAALFWLLSSERAQTAFRDLLASDRAAEAARSPESAAGTAEQRTVEVTVEAAGKRLTIAEAEVFRVETDHPGHVVALTARADGAAVIVQELHGQQRRVLPGEVAAFNCPYKVLETRAEAGVVSMRQSDCPDVLRVKLLTIAGAKIAEDESPAAHDFLVNPLPNSN